MAATKMNSVTFAQILQLKGRNSDYLRLELVERFLQTLQICGVGDNRKVCVTT
jgi:hypothetical protein